jgi:tRNA-dihydrouridine synthase B
MRTGWCDTHKNAVLLARRFEDVGIQMLTVHGRTREQGYKGFAEYDTIAAVKQAVKLPVVANGDITSPEKARDVLAYTGADAIMVGRAAQGRPWIFREIAHFLATGEHLAPPWWPRCGPAAGASARPLQPVRRGTGVRSARKHIAWYLRSLPGGRPDNTSTPSRTAGAMAGRGRLFDALGSRWSACRRRRWKPTLRKWPHEPAEPKHRTVRAR